MKDNQADALRALFSPAVFGQLELGNKIEAIKILREETGMSLIEAKDLIESAEAQDPAKRISEGQRQSPISHSVLDQLMQGKKIEAIKTLRTETGMQLKDAKDAVEQALLDHPEVKNQYDEISKQGRKGLLFKSAVVGVIAYLAYRLFSG